MKVLILFLAAGAVLSAQQGIATRSSVFDPATSPRGPVDLSLLGPPQRRAVLTPAQEAMHKAFVPAHGPSGIPQLESGDGRRAPGDLQVQLQNAPSMSLQGLTQDLYPPSPNAAAGPEDVIQVINSKVARYDRSGNVTDIVPLPTWFKANLSTVCPSGIANGCIFGDVAIRYDQIHGRFLLSLQVSDSFAGTSFLAISVSNGATYASGFKNWLSDATLDGNVQTFNFADFPQIGFDDKAVYLSSIMFSFFGVPSYSKIRIFKKSDLYNPSATTMPYFDIPQLVNEDGTVATIQPAHVRGRVGVGPAGALFVSSSELPGVDYLTLWRINDPVRANPTITRTTIHGVVRYAKPAAAPQLGAPAALDSGPPDVLKAVYREGLLYTAQNTGHADEPTTVSYSILNVATNTVANYFRWRNGSFFYPAFDIPATVGPGGFIPNKLITATTTDANGNLTYAGIKDVKQGEDSYTPNGAGQARYGEFFGGAIDPVDGGMWVSGEYAKMKTQIPNVSQPFSQYGTWIAYFPWVTMPTFDDVLPGATNYDFINVLAQWGITKGCTPRLFCPGNPTTRGQMAVFIIRSIYADTFSYPQTPYFTDVPASHPYFSYIQKLRQLGITQGCSATTFCVDAPVTRSQAAVFVVRAKLSALFGDAFSFPGAAYFTDVPATHPHYAFVQKLRELGVSQGCGASLFCPDAPVTREQVAMFVVRAFLN